MIYAHWIINEVEYVFLCLLIIFLIFQLFADFLCPVFYWVLVSFLMIHRDSLYIKVINPCEYVSRL